MEDFKSFKLVLDFADESGNRTKKEQTIKVNTPTLRDKSSISVYYQNSIYTLSYTIKIPDFIHTYIIGKSVPSKNGTTEYSEDFSKSIRRDSIEALTVKWSEIISDYVWLKKIDNSNLKKVIYFDFQGEMKAYKSSWDSKIFGEYSQLEYKYAVGYIATIDEKEQRYNKDKRMISYSSSYEKGFYTLKYVEWTEEREAFFINILKSFEAIINKMQNFKDAISEESINQLMSKSIFLALKES